MAYAAIGNVDLNVMGARGAALDVDGFKQPVASIGSVGFDGHGNAPDFDRT
jgi:hypothetical protein